MHINKTMSISISIFKKIEFLWNKPITFLQTQTQLGIRVIGFNSPLYYANGDMFVKQVFQIVGLKPERARKQIKRLGSILEFRRVVRN